MAHPTIDRLTAVQDTIVLVVTSAQEPVAGSVRRAAELAGGALPDLPSLPLDALGEALPPARELVDNQFDFATRLLGASRDLATAVVDALGPVAGRPSGAGEPEGPAPEEGAGEGEAA